MTQAELKAEVDDLKKQVYELSRVKDYVEIWKLQSRYAHLYQICRRLEIPSLFAQKVPGVSIEIEDSGVYEGIEGVKRFWTMVSKSTGGTKSRPGDLAVHMTVNPVIEINNDGTKAKGVWFSHGCASLKHGENYLAMWCLGKYDMEYVKEDDEWKFLKFAYRIIYMTPYEKGWVEEPVGASIAGNPLNEPDKPTTYYMPYSRYRINTFPPPPPEPYNND